MSGRHRARSRRGTVVASAIALALLAGGALAVARRDGPDGPAGRAAPSAVGSAVPSPVPTGSPEGAAPGGSAQAVPAKVAEAKGRLVIHGTGDVSLDPGHIPNLRVRGYGFAWSGLRGLFRRDHLTVVNLEGAVSTRGSALPKQFTFRGDPAALPAMRRAGVEVANLGNNHAYDFGPVALLDTIRNLRREGIAPVGAGRDQDAALAPALFELDGWTVAVVGLDLVVDPYPEAVATDSKPGTAAGHDTRLMLRAIRAADREADLVIVTIHWGVELDTGPRPEQVALGRRFIEVGADVVFGHHAHRLQPMSVYRGRPIFWGLGNFVWPALSLAGRTTAVAQVVVRPNGHISGRLLPAFIESSGHPVLREG